MGFEMTVMAFNDGYEISNLVTGLLHFFQSPEWTAILAVAMGIGLLFAWVKFRFIFQHNPTYGLVALFAPLFLWAMLILPTMRLNIQDQYTGEVFTLSKVPVDLGIPLAVSSQFEFALTDVIDKRVFRRRRVETGHGRGRDDAARTSIRQLHAINQQPDQPELRLAGVQRDTALRSSILAVHRMEPFYASES